MNPTSIQSIQLTPNSAAERIKARQTNQQRWRLAPAQPTAVALTTHSLHFQDKEPKQNYYQLLFTQDNIITY